MVGFASALLPQPRSSRHQRLPAPSGYVLGPDDQISIRVLQAPELIDKPVRIDSKRLYRFALYRRVKAAGSTPETSRRNLR